MDDNPQRVNLPEMWAIRRTSDGKLLPPIDEDGTGVFLSWPTHKEALAGLEHQRDLWDFGDYELEVVRLALQES
jgi:hypothetical protein